MLSGAPLIGEWSTGVWQNLGQPSSLSALTISGYASQPNTLGTLNSRLGTCFIGTGINGTGYSYAAEPPLTSAELSIVEGLFLVSWYSQLAVTTMGVGGSTIPWQSLAEGDSKIARTSVVNIGKEYREMAKDARIRLDYLVGAYIDNSAPSAVVIDYLNPGYPYPYGGNSWYNTSSQRGLQGNGSIIG